MPANPNTDDKKARIYAEAIAAYAGDDRDQLVRFYDELRVIFNEYRQENKLQHAFDANYETPEKRAEMARVVFEPFSPGLRDVLVEMAARGDLHIIHFVAEEYKYLAEERLGAVLVTVTTAVELDDHLRDVITRKLEKDFGTDIIIREFVDRSIIGGIIMSAHGKRIDASIASQLEASRVALSATPTGGD